MRIVNRILSLPFVLIIFFITAMTLYVKWVYRYILFGGEFTPYRSKNEPKKIADLYRQLDRLLTHKQQPDDKN